MKPSLISNYIILWVHLITLSLRLFYETNLDEMKFFQLDLGYINKFLNNIFSSELVFDSGILDILNIFTIVSSFYLGKYYGESLIILFISTLLLEVFIIYNNKSGRLMTVLGFSLTSFLLGKMLKSDKNVHLLENSYANKDMYNDDINTQEYATYKLY